MEPVFAKYTLELIALGLVTVEAQLCFCDMARKRKVKCPRCNGKRTVNQFTYPFHFESCDCPRCFGKGFIFVFE